MSSIQIKLLDSDNENETLYQCKEVRLKSKRIQTPIMALDPSLFKKDQKIAPITKGFNEIYKRVETRQTPLSELIRDIDKQDAFNYRINTDKNKTDVNNEITVCYIESVGNKYPEEKELEFILDTSYCYSDIVPLPIVQRITKSIQSDKNFEDYLTFLKRSIEFLKSFNGKPMMGIIPRLAYIYIGKLVEFYVSNDINVFSVDLACRNVVTLKQPLLSCFRKLNEYGLLEEGFVNAINTSPGRFIKEKNVINSKDVLCYGFGFDSIGRRHRPLQMPKEVWDQIDRSSNKLRLFNKDDYGYYKIMGNTQVDAIYQLDSSIPREVFRNPTLTQRRIINRYENIYNAEQIGLESFRLRNIVKDNSPRKYISEKVYVKKQDIKKITNFKFEVTAPDLQNYFNE